MRLARILACAVFVGALTVSAAPAVAAPSLSRYASTAGTAWWTDPADGRTVVAVDGTVAPGAVTGLATALRARGGRLVHDGGTLRKHIAGADPFFRPGGFGRCLVGFNARSDATYYFLTSAHCVGPVATTVYADPAGTTVLGVVSSINAGYDFALVRYTNATIAKPSAVNLYNGTHQPITSFGTGYVGQTVARSGPNGVHAGTITALNVTVNYPEGAVSGLIRTNICSEPGDSGGPLFAKTVGIGVTSGGSGNCTTGGTSYYSSAARAGSAYGIGPY